MEGVLFKPGFAHVAEALVFLIFQAKSIQYEVGFSSINSFITRDNKNNNNTILAMALAYLHEAQIKAKLK